VACRGGGEFGIDWRNQGSKAYKQNVFNDFQACSEYLISADYTNTSKLTIQARSAPPSAVSASATLRTLRRVQSLLGPLAGSPTRRGCGTARMSDAALGM